MSVIILCIMYVDIFWAIMHLMLLWISGPFIGQLLELKNVGGELTQKLVHVQKLQTLQALQDVIIEECAKLLINVAKFSTQEVLDVELVLQMIPTIHLDLCAQN